MVAGDAQMALLLDSPTACLGASPDRHACGRPPYGLSSDVAQLIEHHHLDPTDFQIRHLALHDQASFPQAQLVVTVTNGRARASRTYVSRAHPDEWLLDFEQDLRAGVFSPPA